MRPAAERLSKAPTTSHAHTPAGTGRPHPPLHEPGQLTESPCWRSYSSTARSSRPAGDWAAIAPSVAAPPDTGDGDGLTGCVTLKRDNGRAVTRHPSLLVHGSKPSGTAGGVQPS